MFRKIPKTKSEFKSAPSGNRPNVWRWFHYYCAVVIILQWWHQRKRWLVLKCCANLLNMHVEYWGIMPHCNCTQVFSINSELKLIIHWKVLRMPQLYKHWQNSFFWVLSGIFNLLIINLNILGTSRPPKVLRALRLNIVCLISWTWLTNVSFYKWKHNINTITFR